MTTQGRESSPDRALDVLVVGAGLSGVAAAYRLSSECPDHNFRVLEARDAPGGTWDLFRYPGIRSDSDMYTFGFAFEPWTGPETMATGETIRDYVHHTIHKHGLQEFICYGHRLLEADWSEQEKCWQLLVETPEGQCNWTTRFLWLCTGYFDYKEGFLPDIPGLSDFQGEVVHPQHWPSELNYEGRDVVVIGSGATAITLIPALAKKTRLVTMLQRSPSYVSEVPSVDPWARHLRRFLPVGIAMTLLRWKGMLYQTFVFKLARNFPNFMRKLLMKPWRDLFGDQYAEEHFNPSYNPWEQRLCVDADGEFTQALQQGKAQIITDTIETCTRDGIKLHSGKIIKTDIIVTATGLKLQMLGNARIKVGGKPVQVSNHLIYKGLMFSGIPNLALSLGYTNMSWTLKCDLIARYVCRLLKFMSEKRHKSCRPILEDPTVEPERLIDFSSGYFQRSVSMLPKQGSKAPWKLHQSYIHDLIQTGFARLDDGTLQFES